jgi:molybdate transport system substrate-binding protein
VSRAGMSSLVFAALMLFPLPAWAAPEMRLAAASDLRAVLPGLLEAFKTEARVTYGSSGKLATQIVQGAPFDVFLSADQAPVELLVARGLVVPGSRTPYAIGVVMLWTRNPGAPEKQDWQKVLRQAPGVRVAIAHPEHAPYGRAAFEALQEAGLHPRVVRAENVALAAQMAASGQVAYALTARSLLSLPQLATGMYWELPPEAHAPLVQEAVVLTRRQGPAALNFVRFLQQATAQRLLAAAGFRPPPAAASVGGRAMYRPPHLQRNSK